MTDKINVPHEDERMPQKSVMQWVQEWSKLVHGEETERPSVYPIRIEGLEQTTNGPQEFTVEFMYTGPESSAALEAVKAELKERGIVNVVEAKETKMNKPVAQIVGDSVRNEMKMLNFAARYGKQSKETEPKTVTFAVPNELHDLIADACNRPSFSIGCKLDGTDIVQFSPLTGNVVKRSEKHVSVEDYNTLQACIEKESYADGDDEFDKACVQVSETVRLKELEAEIAKLQQEQDSRQKETDNLVLELRQYVERYRNANTRATAAEMKFAEFVRQGVLKMTPNGHEPVLTREHIDETVFMCKIRANRMAEALHKYKYQKNNAYASDKDRETAETEYMTALQLFNDTFADL